METPSFEKALQDLIDTSKRVRSTMGDDFVIPYLQTMEMKICQCEVLAHPDMAEQLQTLKEGMKMAAETMHQQQALVQQRGVPPRMRTTTDIQKYRDQIKHVEFIDKQKEGQ